MSQENITDFRSKQSALLNILQIAGTKSAKFVMYASALGAIAILLPTGAIPATLTMIAGGVGVNLLSNIIERVAQGKQVSNDEVLEAIEKAIAESKISDQLSNNDTQRAFAKLFRRMDLLNYAVENSEFTVVNLLTKQFEEYKLFREEFKNDFIQLQNNLNTIATKVQVQEVIERLKYWEYQDRGLGREVFTQSWFQMRLNEVIEVAGPRYTPPIHVELPIAHLFDGLARTQDFYIRIKHLFRDIRKQYQWIRLDKFGPELEQASTEFHEQVQQLISKVYTVDESLVDPIPWEEIVEMASRTCQSAYSLLEQFETWRREARETNKEKVSTSPTDQESQDYNNTRYRVHSFIQDVQELGEFAQNSEACLSNLPALLLCGTAGQGKTHLFCDIAARRITVGLPTILLMGQRFTQAEPWTQILRQLGIPETVSRDDFLGALQSVAKTKNAKALFMIDALNEGEGKRIWFTELPAVLQTLSHYPWISVAISVRSSYERVIISEGLLNNKLIGVEHPGFAEHEYQATRTFFDYYGIEQPSIPLLLPEFQNPLFLKLLCKGLKEKGISKIPSGFHGVTAIFRLFVDAIDEKLWREAYSQYYTKPRSVIWKAIDRLAGAMAEKQQDWLVVDEAEEIVNQLAPVRNNENSLFRNLVDEGILVENRRWFSQDEGTEVIQFAYEKFSDHLIVKHLIDKYLDLDNPEQSFLAGQPFFFLTENTGRYQGLIEALCVQLPEQINKELPEVAPMIANSRSVGRSFIESIVWRNPKAISEITTQYLNKYNSQISDATNWTLDALLTVASIPDHPYNADFLHRRLIKDELAERDVWWSIFLHQEYGMHNAVDRLLDWAWSQEDKHHVSDEAVRLCGVTLVWFLTTSNRFLRDRATKALVNLFTHQIPTLITVMEKFVTVNDPYILERLYAVAYGCALRSVNDREIGVLAHAVYCWVFKDGKPPAHILLRDYARGVIEFALYREIEINVEVDKIRPPYQSDWLTDIPTLDEIALHGKWWEGMPQEEWSRVEIHSSVMGLGDFSRYIIGTNLASTSWSWLSLRLTEPNWQSPEDRFTTFVQSLTEKQRVAWQQYQEQLKQSKDAIEYLFHPIFEKFSQEDLALLSRYWETSHEETETLQVIQRFDSEIDKTTLEAIEEKAILAESAFRQILDLEQLQAFEVDILVFLNENHISQDEPRFDLSIAQRWVMKRVFDLGWTVERFGWFDRNLSRNDYREAHKAERIGKKYQWIAYHEFLARLADNYQYRKRYSDHPQDRRYDGTWQDHLRDIDPSCVLRSTGRGSNWRITVPAWWFPGEYQGWESIVDDVAWMNQVSDLPDVRSFIEISNPKDNSQWYAIDGFYHWEQPTPAEEERSDLTRKEFFYILTGYLVHKDDCDEFYNWALEQNFMGRWMPEGPDFYGVFLGEFYWSPAYSYHSNPYENEIGWREGGLDKRIPKSILPLVENYIKEDSGFDCSIDSGIGITLPNRLLVERMGLNWNGHEGKFFNETGELVAFDPSVDEDGPSSLLIQKEAFLSFLQENNYCVVWTLLAEKQLVGGGYRHDEWKGRLEISGVYRLINGEVQGQLTPRFRSPHDRV